VRASREATALNSKPRSGPKKPMISMLSSPFGSAFGALHERLWTYRGKLCACRGQIRSKSAPEHVVGLSSKADAYAPPKQWESLFIIHKTTRHAVLRTASIRSFRKSWIVQTRQIRKRARSAALPSYSFDSKDPSNLTSEGFHRGNSTE
jgi:hypothetical protein